MYFFSQFICIYLNIIKFQRNLQLFDVLLYAMGMVLAKLDIYIFLSSVLQSSHLTENF